MSMTVLLLPDFIAMLLLTVLLLVQSKRTDGTMRRWTAGLLLILLECAARMVYDMALPRGLHRLAHVVALDSYGLAGAIFLNSASRLLRRMPGSRLFLLWNILPHLALFTLYGLESDQAWLYRACALLGLTVGFVTSALLRRSRWFYMVVAAVWLPVLLCTWVQQYRMAVYLALCFLYALSALFFHDSLRRGSRGKIAVVAGFSVWAICFATHPWIASAHPRWVPFVSQFWNMQKFVITVGFLLLLLEEQVRSNEWLALHDELTGLPNRRLFEDRLQHALAHAERTGSRLALFNVDLDGFKQVNDTLGHDAGDLLLKRVSSNLRRSLRRADTLARLGGDEFALIADLDGVGAHHHDPQANGRRLPQVQRILATMLRAVKTPIQMGEAHGGGVVEVGASIGVAVYPDDALEMQSLIRLADQRMYAEKTRDDDPRGPADEYSDFDLQSV